MKRIHDQPLAGMCAKGTLLGLTRTGGLVACAVLASILLVGLPLRVERAAEAPAYVPAAETWIEPGAASRTEATEPDNQSSRPTGVHDWRYLDAS
jgi:hypothetical protein